MKDFRIAVVTPQNSPQATRTPRMKMIKPSESFMTEFIIGRKNPPGNRKDSFFVLCEHHSAVIMTPVILGK